MKILCPRASFHYIFLDNYTLVARVKEQYDIRRSPDKVNIWN